MTIDQALAAIRQGHRFTFNVQAGCVPFVTRTSTPENKMVINLTFPTATTGQAVLSTLTVK